MEGQATNVPALRRPCSFLFEASIAGGQNSLYLILGVVQQQSSGQCNQQFSNSHFVLAMANLG